MITVHGLLGVPSAALRTDAAAADLVVGGRRHLDALGVPEERRVVLGPISQAVERLAALPADADALVVASGDPLLYGVVRRLRAAGLRPRVVTAPSSVQAAFAAAGLPWDDALVVSAHGHDPRPALNACRACPKVAVLTDLHVGVRELATGLRGLGRRYVLAERLGEDDERIRTLTEDEALATSDVRQPNVVLVLDPDAHEHPSPRPIAGPAPDRTPPATVGPTAAVASALLAAGIGDLVWVEGVVGAEVSTLARARLAAVWSLDDQGPGASGVPDLAVLAGAASLARLGHHRPRRIVVVTGPEADVLGTLAAARGDLAWREHPSGDPAHRLYLGDTA